MLRTIIFILVFSVSGIFLHPTNALALEAPRGAPEEAATALSAESGSSRLRDRMR